MVDTTAIIAGELEEWPSKERFCEILRDSVLRLNVGWYAIRIEDCSHFVFRECGGDLGDPVISADTDTAEELLREAKLVSDALAKACIRHRFEILDEVTDLAGYLHYDWPLQDDV